MRIKYILATLLFLLISSKTVFAADSALSGIISDEKNNPVAGGVVVFLNETGKTVKAVVADLNGVYSTTIPQNTYTIQVSGPTGSTLPSLTLEKQVISGSTTRNFTIPNSGKKIAQRPTISKNLAILLILIATVCAVGIPSVVIVFMKKRKKNLPEASSSH